MSLAQLLDRTATIRRRSVVDVDDYGNDVWGTTTVEVVPCYLEQTGTTEELVGRHTLVADHLLIVPAGSRLDQDDTVVVDGTEFHVVGLPDRVHNPRTRRTVHVEAQLARSTG